MVIEEVVLLISARYGESSSHLTQTAQRKEEPTEESTRDEESQSWYWQKGTVQIFCCSGGMQLKGNNSIG